MPPGLVISAPLGQAGCPGDAEDAGGAFGGARTSRLYSNQLKACFAFGAARRVTDGEGDLVRLKFIGFLNRQ
jgi:hypothetical protein